MEVVRTLQDAPPWVTDVAEVITFLGDAEFYLLAFPLLYWSISRRLGLHLGIILLLSASINAILKMSLASPRPGFLEPDLAVTGETSYGLPSGHSQNAVALWGLLAAELRSRWWWLFSATLILALGWSRLQLGVHFPIDTLLGFAVGGVLLVAYLRLRGPVTDWFGRHSPWQQVGLAFGASMALVGLAVVARLALAGSSVPAEWVGIDPADPPFSLDSAVTASSTLFGIISGVVLLGRRGGFETDGTWWRRALRYPIGLVGVAVIWLGLGSDPTGDDVAALVLRYVQYGLIGLWIGGLAPLLFVRLGLAPRAGPRTHTDAGTPAASEADRGVQGDP